MKIGLIDIEPKIFNTALMQISMSYINAGIDVRWASPLVYDQCDKLYCSSLFDFTDKSGVPERAICGGTGFDIKKKLDISSAKNQLNYDIYPKCKTSYLWFSRGCNRNCPWCIVRQKEGKLRPVTPKYINPDGEYITVMDNSFFSNPRWEGAMSFLQAQGQPVDFQGVDVRTLTQKMCNALNTLRHYKQIKIAWDDPTENIIHQLGLVTTTIKPYRLMCYVLIGFNSTQEQDLYRVETLRNLGIDSFVMPYNKKDLYQKAFARWVNHKAIFKKVPWKDYNKRVLKQENSGTGWTK